MTLSHSDITINITLVVIINIIIISYFLPKQPGLLSVQISSSALRSSHG